jgi:hypothetical protein
MADAMKLPLRDRVRLAQQLISTLDDETEPESKSCGLQKLNDV